MLMKIKLIFSKLAIIYFFFYSLPLICGPYHEEDPCYEWFEAKEVYVNGDEVLCPTVKGAMRLNVVEYDAKNDRYLVRCRCHEDSHLNPLEALAFPFSAE